MFLDLYRRLITNKSGRPAKKRGRNPWKARLSMELLETRLTPASIWTVTTLSDNPVHTGLSLRDAIIDANANPGSTVNFAKTLAGAIQLQQGDLDITAVMTVDGSTSKTKNITIDANGKDRVFDISTPGTVTLKNLTIKDGVAPSDEGLGNGGGIYSASKLSSLTLINDNILNNNTATSPPEASGVVDSGGGVYSNGGVSLINTVVNKNTAADLGGGVYAVTKLIVTNSSIIENNVAGSGGGLYLAGTGSTLTITSSKVIQNQAIDGDGGGVWAEFNVNATSSTVDANTATHDGGGIFSNHGNVYLTRTHVDGNQAGADGGGIWADYTVLVRVSSSVDNNTAGGLVGGNGGGIYSKHGFVRVDASEVDGNQAKDPPIPTGVDPGNGGGIWSGGDVFVQNSGAVDNNTANGDGGGIHAVGNVSVTNGGEVNGNTAITATSSLNYSDFSSTAGLTLNGNAFQNGNVVELTDANTGEAGSAFYNAPLDLTQSFSTQFQFSLSGSNTSTSADGITFTIQNSGAGASALGGGGGGLGYFGITPSLAVEFDTFDNGFTDGFSNNHVAILIDGNVVNVPDVDLTDPGFALYGSGPVNAWIDYDATSHLLSVFVAQSTTKPGTPLITFNYNLAANVGSTAYVGFTGGTGAEDSAQDIQNWQLTSSAVNGNGGGIYAKGDVYLDAGNVDNNNAGNNGGGIYQPCNPCQHNTYIEDGSSVSGNNAANDGGGIWNEGGQVNVEGCSVIDGNTADHDGGGIWSGNGVLYIDSSTMSNNTAGNNGGGVWVGTSDDGTACAETCPGEISVTITHARFLNNTAGNDGGGLFSVNVLNLAISYSEFTGNVAQSGDGGAMAITGCGDSSIDDTTFSGDTASEFGGAIYVAGAVTGEDDHGGGGQTMYLDHNTFNECVAYGGYGTGCDLYADDDAYVIIVNNLFDDTTGLCKLWNNDLIDSSSTSTKSDFDNDSDGDDSVEGASGSNLSGTVNSEGSNLVADNSGSNVNGFSNLIGDIADGLQGLTFVPGTDSTCSPGYYKLKKATKTVPAQAIKAGDNEGPYIDAAGHTRPTDGSPSDIGAVQYF